MSQIEIQKKHANIKYIMSRTPLSTCYLQKYGASKPPSNHEEMAKQRPPSPEDFFPELPLLALLFFAMAAAPNWLHNSWQQFCSGCLFGCFLSEQFNGVLWVVQNSWVKHGQHSHTCQDSVVNLDGHTGPHAAWYCW